MDDEPAGPTEITFRACNVDRGQLFAAFTFESTMRDDWRELSGKASGEVVTIVGPRRHLGRTNRRGSVGWLEGITRGREPSSY
jgi:hypothetical protein